MRCVFSNTSAAVALSYEAAPYASPGYSGASPESYRSAGFPVASATALVDGGQRQTTTHDMEPNLAQSSTPGHIVHHTSLPWDPVYSENWPRNANGVPNLPSVAARSRSCILGLDMRDGAPVETDQMVVYLFQHFSEKPGKWY